MTRIAQSHSKQALYRALRCATEARTDCILAGEIGFGLPAVFLYANDGMRMLAAPRIVHTSNETAFVKVAALGGGARETVEFAKQITVEFVPQGSRAPQTETFAGQDSYCVQFARRSYDDECWEQLD